MDEIVITEWNGDMSFTSDVEGYSITMDALPENGGNNRGPKPRPLLLASLAGCTGMDIVSILAKMRVNLDKFTIGITGDVVEEHPKYYQKIHLVYEFWGGELPAEKIEKAIELSRNRYCGVNKMLKTASEMSWEMVLHENPNKIPTE